MNDLEQEANRFAYATGIPPEDALAIVHSVKEAYNDNHGTV